MSSFHSIEEQERFEAREAMSSDVDELRQTIQEQADRIKELEDQIKHKDWEIDQLNQIRA